MDNDNQVLKEKALLLINRERELLTLRNKHQRLLNWLSLSQSLPEVVDRRFSLAEIGSKFVNRIISAIKLQRVHLLEFTTDGVRPLALTNRHGRRCLLIRWDASCEAAQE